MDRSCGTPGASLRRGRWTGFIAALLGAALISLSAAAAKPTGESVVSGGAGDDEVYGSPGSGLIAGKGGDDFIEAKDGRADYVSCGPGDDVASTDPRDRAAADCETVYEG